jgi:hypothetical protein
MLRFREMAYRPETMRELTLTTFMCAPMQLPETQERGDSEENTIETTTGVVTVNSLDSC